MHACTHFFSKASDPVPVVGPQFERSVLDVHGRSPLVQHYLQQRNLSREDSLAQLTRRTELGEDMPPASVPSFKEVLEESEQQDKRNHAQFKRSQSPFCSSYQCSSRS